MKRNRGVALAISLFSMMMVTALSAVYVTRAVQEKTMSGIEVNALKASYAGESGGNDGLLTLYNLINFYLLNTVSATPATTVSTQAANYATADNGIGFLIAYVKHDGVALMAKNGTGASAEAVYTATTTAIDNGRYVYTIRVTRKSAASSPMTNVWDFPFNFKIQTTATVAGLNKKLTLHGDFTVRVQRDNFARYSLFTAHQTMSNGTTVWFTGSTNFTGPLFTDTKFSFAYNPGGTFDGLVKQVDQTAQFYNNGNPVLLDADSNGTRDIPDFTTGFQRGLTAISMPTSADETTMATEASGGVTYASNGIYVPLTGTTLKGGIYVYGDATVTMGVDSHSRQTLNIVRGATTDLITIDREANQTLVTSGGTTTTYTGLPDGTHKVGTVVYVNGNITSISGTVQGDNQMTIASKNDLVISGNIHYEHYTAQVGTPGTTGYVAPTAAGATNLLGLMSWQGNVRVGTTAPNNLDIHATVMAKTGQFQVDNYDTGSARGTVTVLGGVITNYYGAFGTFNSSTGQFISGYGRNFVYDDRMQTSMSPPYFPTTNTFIAFANDIDDKLFWQQGGF